VNWPGLLFDPRSILDPDRPYLQLVDPIPTELGPFEPVFIDRIGRLALSRPPIENLVAAKLIRCEPRDLSDIRFLISRHRPDLAAIRRLVENRSPKNRERPSENLVYLSVIEQ